MNGEAGILSYGAYLAGGAGAARRSRCNGGFFDVDGTVPCQIDGGVKCFGHPIDASGLR